MGQGYQESTRGDVELLKEKYICYKNKSIFLDFFQLPGTFTCRIYLQ